MDNSSWSATLPTQSQSQAQRANRLLRGGNYCLAISLPVAMHKPADWTLAASLVAGPLFLASFVAQANEWIAMAGGLIGLGIASVRLYRLLKGKE